MLYNMMKIIILEFAPNFSSMYFRVDDSAIF